MAEVFYFHVQEDRSIKYKLPEPIMQEDKDVATWRFRIPKVLNNIDMSAWSWWFVYVNAKGQEYSELLTLTDDIDEPSSYSTADYDIDYGISKFPGSFSFALEAISTEQGGEISGEWHTRTYSHKVDKTLQGNQAEYAETESDVISALMQEVRNKVNQLVGGATPLPVNLKSLMTDHDKVYLYTGSEDGESTGYWYHYNGSNFVPGGLYGAGVQIDPTLSKSGQAADAKVVGEKFSLLQEQVVITHSETVTAGWHTYALDNTIPKGTEVTVIGVSATSSNPFSATFRDADGNTQTFGTLGISAQSITAVLTVDAVVFRSYVNGTDWGFEIRYGSGVVAEMKDLRKDWSGVIHDTAGDAVRTQIIDMNDIVTKVGQVTLALIDIEPSATSENWGLKADGLCESDNTARMRKYLVSSGQLLFVSLSKDTSGVYQFQNSASVPASGINRNLVGSPVSEATESFVMVPEGATHLIVSQLKTNIANVVAYPERTTPTDIVSLNEGAKSMMIQAKRPKNISSNAYLSEPKPLSLLHFSDIHGDATELARMIEFADSNSELVDDVICTGDLVTNRWASDFNYWSAITGAEKILLAIGNHDVLTDESGWDWSQRATQADQYARYFEPFIANWNCSYESGKTYYYKDYDDSKIRLIVLNCMLTGSDDTAQLAWFVSTLVGAKTAGYSVVVANHYMVSSPVKVSCNFSTLDKSVAGADVLPSAYLAEVQNHINDGGKFICYIVGHTHWDVVVKSQDYPDQICIVVDALSRAQGNQYSDTQRTNGDKSQDLANVVVFDTSSGVVKVIRIGASADHYLRQKNCLTIDYSTGNIIAES